MIKRYLLTPGPTPVPTEVALRMAEPMIHHRTPEFSKIFSEVRVGLKALFQTAEDVLVLASSGTGAMEAAVVNLLSAGERVIVVNGGKFGERWTKICQSYGVEVEEIKVEWGEAVAVDAVRAALERFPGAKAVFVQASETSTTVVHPVEEIAALTRTRDTLLIVDGITAVGVFDVPMDRWGIDVLVTGSQKALMLPPGLAFLALSARAWKRAARPHLPGFYFDLMRERKSQGENTTAYTPAVSLVLGLHAVLAMLEREGYPNVFARHARLAAATRAAGEALGLKLLAPRSPSPAATGLYLPGGIDGGKLTKYLRDRVGVSLAGGQDQLKGKILRVAHVGYFGEFDIVTAVAAIEMALGKFGARVDFGSGVAAAERVLVEGLPSA
ncbi:MAG: alanine--glyoxylate aminotransferase family protein [Deltaproteobacteria bacterium]|nr:alanine--glyoxylate aminotransferase family protein [Deltaproteobacteria bacterium]